LKSIPDNVYEESQPRGVEIGLKDAVGAIKRTPLAYMEDSVSAAEIAFGSWTRPKEAPWKTGQKKGLLAPREDLWPRPQRAGWGLPGRDNFRCQTEPAEYLSGIRFIFYLFAYKDPFDLYHFPFLNQVDSYHGGSRSQTWVSFIPCIFQR
jgi:hypothetical protein